MVPNAIQAPSRHLVAYPIETSGNKNTGLTGIRRHDLHCISIQRPMDTTLQ
jgi:hypothetical protein